MFNCSPKGHTARRVGIVQICDEQMQESVHHSAKDGTYGWPDPHENHEWSRPEEFSKVAPKRINELSCAASIMYDSMPNEMNDNIEGSVLVTGANGQVGTVLCERLVSLYGNEKIICTDIRKTDQELGVFEYLNVLDDQALVELIRKYKVKQIYHLAAILSANGERNPSVTWNVNFSSYLKMLQICLEEGVGKLFYPSTIAVFGPTTPRKNTGQDVPLMPTTVYGMSKMAGEVWNQYYHDRYGLDVRSVRYPGIIGYQSLPGGGTTDYAVEIFHSAVKGEKFICYLEPDARLPMIYMDDAINATIDIMVAPKQSIALNYGYNIAGFSFTPAELYVAIKKYIPSFQIEYQPDERQKIAESWPEVIDDSKAKEHWNWEPQFDLDSMVLTMIENLKK